MARSDLLVSLVRAGASGDSKELTSTVEAIIAEERAKQHNILADRLARALRSNGNGGQTGFAISEPVARARDYVLEAPARKRLEDSSCRSCANERAASSSRSSIARACCARAVSNPVIGSCWWGLPETERRRSPKR